MSPSDWVCCLFRWLQTTLTVKATSIGVILVIIAFVSTNLFRRQLPSFKHLYAMQAHKFLVSVPPVSLSRGASLTGPSSSVCRYVLGMITNIRSISIPLQVTNALTLFVMAANFWNNRA